MLYKLFFLLNFRSNIVRLLVLSFFFFFPVILELKRQLSDQERVHFHPPHTTQHTQHPTQHTRDSKDKNRGDVNIPHTADRNLDRDSRHAVHGMSPSEMSIPTAVMDWRDGREGRGDREGKGERDERGERDGREKRGIAISPSLKSSKNDNKKELKMISDRNKMIAEHRSMQEELMRTSDALETLQQLIKDRDKTNTRKEKTFLAEKESLIREAKNATTAFQTAKDEVKLLLRERDYMVRSLDEFSRQLYGLAGEEDRSVVSPVKYNTGIDGTVSPSDNTPHTKDTRTKNRNNMNSNVNLNINLSAEKETSNRSGIYGVSGSGKKERGVYSNDVRTNSTSTATSTSTSSHVSQAIERTYDSPYSKGRDLKGYETEGAVELDGVIRSMQSVVNDRKRVRRLCRHQQLSIMALR